ncbi:hypothetical protein JCM33374_g1409 [Metschnikowia sp. JCM 33374]|nr:hypothetical protein JCM33374_g1409 [Metschnikowia sp. JCM 33374]
MNSSRFDCAHAIRPNASHIGSFTPSFRMINPNFMLELDNHDSLFVAIVSIAEQYDSPWVHVKMMISSFLASQS